MTLIVVKDKLREFIMLLQFLVILICIYLLVITLDFDVKGSCKLTPKECPQKLIKFLIEGGQSSLEGQIPSYKFYSNLVGELIIYRNKFGCEVKSSLLEVRKSITLDLKETKKQKDLFYGGLFQYIFLVIFLWVFLIFASRTIKFSIPTFDLGVLILWQVIGLGVYYIIIHLLKLSLFNSFEIFLHALYKLKIMLKVSRPLNEIIQAIWFENLPNSSAINHIETRIDLLCQEIKFRGIVHSAEIDLALEEVWDFYEIQLLKFNKYLAVLKLTLIFVFVLPCFFYITRLIMGSMGL
jgi:hypothetical protein